MTKEHNMERLIRILIERLVDKGVEISTIPSFIRDVANTNAVNPCPGLLELNKKLHMLGWDDIEVDDYTLQLIIAIFESDLDSSGPSSLGQHCSPDIDHCCRG